LLALILDTSKIENYLRNDVFSSQILYKGGDWFGLHGVDLRESQSKKAIPGPTGECGRELLGTFDSLVLNCNSSNSNNILCIYQMANEVSVQYKQRQ
jgi:hypothetical protein